MAYTDWNYITGAGASTSFLIIDDATSSGTAPKVLQINNGPQYFSNISGGPALNCAMSAWANQSTNALNLHLRSQNLSYNSGTYYQFIMGPDVGLGGDSQVVAINRVTLGSTTTITSVSVTGNVGRITYGVWTNWRASVLTDSGNNVALRAEVLNRDGTYHVVIDAIDSSASRILSSGQFKFGAVSTANFQVDDVKLYTLT